MQRIGLAASKMAKGNLLRYNLFVVGISSLFSLVLFLVSGFSVLAALLLISFILRGFLPTEFHAGWVNLIKFAIMCVAVLTGILNAMAILKNIKLSKHKL